MRFHTATFGDKVDHFFSNDLKGVRDPPTDAIRNLLKPTEIRNLTTLKPNLVVNITEEQEKLNLKRFWPYASRDKV